MNKAARAIAYLFHPTIIPTLGFLLLFHSDFYFSMLGWQAKRLVLLIIFFTTCILPLLSIALLSINPKFKLSPDSENFRALSLIFTAFSYYLGYLLLLRIEALPVFKLLQLASIFVIVALLPLSFRWKISSHMAALGALTGALIALSFRMGANPMWSIAAVVFISGIVASALLILNKNKLWHLKAGYATGFLILYLVIYFI